MVIADRTARIVSRCWPVIGLVTRRRSSSSAAATCPYLAAAATATTTTDQSPVSFTSKCRPYQDVPTPAGWPIIGTTLDLIRSGGAEFVHKYCDRRHQELGPIYREKMGNQEIVFIADARMMQRVYQFEGKYPQHMVPEPWTIFNEVKGVKRGLFFMDGVEWCSRRKRLNKLLLLPDSIGDYADVFNQVVTDLIGHWDDRLRRVTDSVGDNNKSRDVDGEDAGVIIEHLEKELYNWSIESLGTMIFGRRLGCIATRESNDQTAGAGDDDDDNEVRVGKTKDGVVGDGDNDGDDGRQIHSFVHWVQRIFVESAKMTMVPPRLAYALNLPVWRRFVEAAENALALARSYVEQNFDQIKADGACSTMAIDGKKQQPKRGIINQMFQADEINQEEIVRIITDLFIAAADTTSHATQWALYLLARNPDCQEKLLEEVNRVTGGGQNPVTESHLAELPYVKGVIKEALRLYPVAPFLTRYLESDLDLGGYHIPSGTLVAMSLFTTGRKDHYFEKPDEFRPERWLRDKDTGRNEVNHGHACLPFGLGVRSCIGRRVAEMQMQFLLSRIVQTFHLSPTSFKEIGIKLRMITTPEEAIRLVIKKRRSSQ